jgi:hypothetical protein
MQNRSLDFQKLTPRQIILINGAEKLDIHIEENTRSLYNRLTGTEFLQYKSTHGKEKNQ